MQNRTAIFFQQSFIILLFCGDKLEYLMMYLFTMIGTCTGIFLEQSFIIILCLWQ
jgi:hypothetical protein